MKIPKKSNETVDEPGRAHAGDENFVAKGMLAEPAHNIKEREKYIPTAKQRKPINYLTPDVSLRETFTLSSIAESEAPRCSLMSDRSKLCFR